MLVVEARAESNLSNIENFKIEVNDHTTKKISSIFSTNFYSKPFYSALREVTFNAIDEHIKYNIDKPVLIKVDEPEHFIDFSWEVSVRDFGKGLTESQIKEIYTTFFKSTKENSPTQWGMFGLGSKSPFAVYKEFIVRSYLKDRIETYLMFLADVPKYTKLSSKPNNTNETGLEVIFPVPESFHSRVRNTLTNLYTATYPHKIEIYFEDKPVFRVIEVYKSFNVNDHEVWLTNGRSGLVYSGNIFPNALTNVYIFLPPKYELIANREKLSESAVNEINKFITEIIEPLFPTFNAENYKNWNVRYIGMYTGNMFYIPDELISSSVIERFTSNKRYKGSILFKESILQKIQEWFGVSIPVKELPKRWFENNTRIRNRLNIVYKVTVNGNEIKKSFQYIYNLIKSFAEKGETVSVIASDKFLYELERYNRDLYEYVLVCKTLHKRNNVYLVKDKSIYENLNQLLAFEDIRLKYVTSKYLPKNARIIKTINDKVDLETYILDIGSVYFKNIVIKALELLPLIRKIKSIDKKINALVKLKEVNLVDEIEFNNPFDNDITEKEFYIKLKDIIGY